MTNFKWAGEEPQVDDIDPGKDIFALLFMSFFLINALIMFCIAKQGEQAVNVNTAGKGGGKVIEASLLASIDMKDGKAGIIQNGVRYLLPDDLPKLLKDGRFETRQDEKGEKRQTLIVEDPGKQMTAGQMLSVVQILNNAKIGVDFRTVQED